MYEDIVELFLENFHDVAKIGATEGGGVHRQAATAEDKQTRDWFARFAAARQWPVEIDHIGNMFALVNLVEDPTAQAILVGSHLDSQPYGGRFDGAYGVVAGLHAADAVQRAVADGDVVATHNLIVVNWFNEEGGRFAPSLMGSAVYAGKMDITDMLAVQDAAGTTVEQALDAIGYRTNSAGPRNVAGYAEIHIEQGRILEREGIQFGAVDSSWYTQKLDIEVLGEQSHTGATAMADRRDALVGASHVVLEMENITKQFPPEALVSSIGQVTVEPNSPIVVNSRVHMVADLRANDPQIVRDARQQLLARFQELASELNLEIVARDFDIRPNLYFPLEGVELAEKVAADLGEPVRRMQTMAGHDSVSMNTIAPSVMLFIPSKDGVSHCEREFTADEDMAAGLRWLTGILNRMVQGALDGAQYPGSAEQYETSSVSVKEMV